MQEFISHPRRLSSTEKVRCCSTPATQLKIRQFTSNIHTSCVTSLPDLDESLIPLAIFNYLYDPFDLWYYFNSWAMWGSFFAVTPRMWYFSDLKYMINKMFLLRGGRVLKIETMSISGERYTHWFETFTVRPLTADLKNFDDRDEADFLQE